MAKQNRTEIQSANSTALVPVITAAALLTQQNNTMAANAVYKKDVIFSTDISGLTNLVADFAAYDSINYTNGNNNLSITATGLADGERAFISIQKGAGNTITWAGGIIDNSANSAFINSSLTKVIYEIVVKSGVTYVVAQTKNLYEATVTELLAGTPNKYVTPDKLQTNTWYEVGNDGGSTTYTNGWTAFSEGLMYKVDIFGNLILQGRAAGSSATSGNIFKFNDLTLIPTTSFGSLGKIPFGVASNVSGGSVVGFQSVYLESSTGIVSSGSNWGTVGDRFETRGCLVYNIGL